MLPYSAILPYRYVQLTETDAVHVTHMETQRVQRGTFRVVAELERWLRSRNVDLGDWAPGKAKALFNELEAGVRCRVILPAISMLLQTFMLAEPSFPHGLRRQSCCSLMVLWSVNFL